jgi:hypothetical protein
MLLPRCRYLLLVVDGRPQNKGSAWLSDSRSTDTRRTGDDSAPVPVTGANRVAGGTDAGWSVSSRRMGGARGSSRSGWEGSSASGWGDNSGSGYGWGENSAPGGASGWDDNSASEWGSNIAVSGWTATGNGDRTTSTAYKPPLDPPKPEWEWGKVAEAPQPIPDAGQASANTQMQPGPPPKPQPIVPEVPPQTVLSRPQIPSSMPIDMAEGLTPTTTTPTVPAMPVTNGEVIKSVPLLYPKSSTNLAVFYL